MSLLRAKEKPRAKFSFAKRSAGGSSTSSTSSTPPPPPPPPPPAAAPSPPSSSLTPDPPSSSSRGLSAHGNPAASTYALSDLHYQHITPARITAQGEYTLSVENISQSVIDLRPVPSPPSTLSPSLNDNTTLSSLHVRNLSRCVLITPPMAGSALLHDLKDCLVVLASHQVGGAFHSHKPAYLTTPPPPPSFHPLIVLPVQSTTPVNPYHPCRLSPPLARSSQRSSGCTPPPTASCGYTSPPCPSLNTAQT